jgi:PKD repeat protein
MSRLANVSARIALLMSVLVGTLGLGLLASPASAVDAVKAWSSHSVGSDAASGASAKFLRAATASDGTTVPGWPNGNGVVFGVRDAGSAEWVQIANPIGLVVTDDEGSVVTTTEAITLTSDDEDPIAAFEIECDYLVCDFYAAEPTDDIGVLSYTWDFGDGPDSMATGVEQTYTYSATGTYLVKLTVEDEDHTFHSVTHFVSVARLNFDPTTAFDYSCTHLVCDLDASASYDSDGTIVSYAWTFGDTGSGVGISPGHIFTDPGTYPITLTVTDNEGGTATFGQNVTVNGLSPTPEATLTSECTKLGCTFDGSYSTDDGTIESYAWDFRDGGTASGETATHTYAASGKHVVTLTITDDDGATDTTTKTVTLVVSQGPHGEFVYGCTDLSCGFDAGGSTDDVGVVSYAWNFGDGTAPQVVTDSALASHVYNSPGHYPVLLTVKDQDGGLDYFTQFVSVVVADFSYGCTDLRCEFDGGLSSDGDDLTYAWAFGDGVMGAGATPSHTFAAGATYNVRLTVTDDEQGTGSATLPVTVTEPAAVTYVSSRSAHATTKTARVTVPRTVEAGDKLLLILTVNEGSPAVDTPTGVKGLTVLGSTRAKTMRTIVWTTTATAASGGNTVEVRLDHAAKTTLTIAAYDGVDMTVEPTIRVDKDLGTTKARSTPSIRAQAGSWVLSYWADKSDRTTAWTTGHATSRQSDCGTGSGHICSLLADSSASVPAGVYDGVTARTDRPSSLATLFSVVLTPGD